MDGRHSYSAGGSYRLWYFFIIELFHDLDVWLHACTAALSCPLTFIYAAQKIPISKFEEDEELCYAG